jgi:hypothetical protein
MPRLPGQSGLKLETGAWNSHQAIFALVEAVASEPTVRDASAMLLEGACGFVNADLK